MLSIVSIKDFLDLVQSYNYIDSGDNHEKKLGIHVTDLFPNSEKFWRLFVIPMTNRIDKNYKGNDNNRIGLRKVLFETGNDLIDIQRINYSILFNLISAYNCFEDKKRISSFENFYAHLGTVCDLAEEFLIQIYYLTENCRGNDLPPFEKFTKEEFMIFAEKWYCEKYESSYNNYLSKGKIDGSYLPKNKDPFNKYFGKRKERLDYLAFSKLIRDYRNAIIHNPKISGHLKKENIHVPRKEKIKKYIKWHQVHSIDPIINEETFKSDFIEQYELMQGDFNTMKERLNDLWKKPIKDLEQLLYVDQNEVLLNKYDLYFEK